MIGIDARGLARTGASRVPALLAAGTLATALAVACTGTDSVDAEPVAVTLAGGSNPTVAVDSAGAAYIAWVGTTDGESNVYLARVADEEVGEPVRVNDRRGDAAPHAQAPAQVAIGSGGIVYVVWQNNTEVEGRRFPASDLRFARSTDGGATFEPAIHVNDDAGGVPTSHTFHDLAVAADGTVYVSWIDGRRTESDPDRDPDIRIARSTDAGRSFEPSTLVAERACPCCRTSLALSDDGRVYLAWRQVFDGSVRDIVVARSGDGGATFSAPERVHADGWAIDACPHAGPGLAVDRDGRLHVAWYTGREDGPGLYYTVRDNARDGFGRPVRLTSDARAPVSQVSIAADAAQGVWLAWEDPTPEARMLRLGYSDGDEAPERVETGPVRGALPAMAVEAGTAVVAWLEGEAVRVLRFAAEPARAR